VPHYITIDPNEEWQRGVAGWFLRVRGILATVVLDAGASIAAFIWVHWVWTVLLAGAGVFGAIALVLLRRFRLQGMESDQRLHTLCHETRDDVAKVLSSRTTPDHRHRLDEFHKHTVQRIASYFRERLGDRTMNCAIRLAERRQGKDVYATRARSDGMDPIRASQSEPIPCDRGLPSALLQHNLRGVHIVNDIEQAISEGSWMRTRNDSLPDVKKVMVSPINGWDGDQKGMLGMLYVASKTRDFHPCDTLPIKAFADMLGLIYPIIMNPALPQQDGGSPNGS